MLSKIAKWFCIILLTPVVLLMLLSFVWDGVLYIKRPAIARNLPSNFEEAERVFNERVQRSFTIGMSEQELIRQLSTQGFDVIKTDKTSGAVFKESQLICTLVWDISWVAGDDGQVSSIRSGYKGMCV